jgi:hypothetical protein
VTTEEHHHMSSGVWPDARKGEETTLDFVVRERVLVGERF